MRNLLAATAFMALPLAALAAGQGRPASATDIRIPLSDARNVGASSVRFGAAQDTGAMPSVALFGLSRDSWPRVRNALQQAVAQGYPVRAVFMGPTNTPPSLEIYAKGHQVLVNGVNPNAIGEAELLKLIRDVHRAYYGRK